MSSSGAVVDSIVVTVVACKLNLALLKHNSICAFKD